MGAFKRLMGLDVVDTAIHVFTTGCLAGLADAASGSGNSDGVVFFVIATSAMVFGVRRHFALKRQAEYPETTGEVAVHRIEELESRVVELEHGQMHMQELEERLDFAERMLAQQREVRQLSSREEP